LRVRDLTTSARKSLRGSRGPQGPAGAAAVSLRASISPGGDPVAGNATAISHTPGSNVYRVSFAHAVQTCPATATLAAVPAGAADPPAGRITVSAIGSTIVVRTFDAAGAAASVGFNLTVAC
jgi:hypothetical protein